MSEDHDAKRLDARRAVADWHRRALGFLSRELPELAAEPKYIAPAARASRVRFCDDLAAALGRLMDAGDGEKAETSLKFAITMAADILGVAIAQTHDDGLCVPCVSGNLQELADTVMQSYKMQLAARRGDAGTVAGTVQ